MPDLGYEDEAPERIRISMITFAFDNAELINLLKQRGLAIKMEKYDKMREINKKIDDLTAANLKKYNRPVTAFLTFENEEGLNRCKAYEEVAQQDEYKHMATFLEEEVKFEDAAEPTDIIWENRRFTSFERFKRTVIVCLCVFFLLFMSFSVIFICSREANRPLIKYPAQDCVEVKNTQGSSFQTNAFAEWDRNFDKDLNEVEEPIYVGILKCYCDLRKKEDKEFTSSTPVTGFRLKTQENIDYPICERYMSD